MKTKTIFIIALFFSCQSYSQDSLKLNSFKYDASLTVPNFTRNENYRGKLEFRKSAKKNKYYKFSVNFSSIYNDFSILQKTSVDTILMERKFIDFTDRAYMQIGMDKTFGKNKLFTFGGGLIFGYELSSKRYLGDDQLTFIEVSRIWTSTFPIELDDYERIKDILDVHYIITGVELNIGVNIPISTKWQIGIQASPRMIVAKSFKHTLEGELIKVYDHFQTFNIKTDYNLDIALRYRFGKYKTES